MTGDTKARLERSVEVRHGMALRQSQQEVEALKAQLEDDEYAQRLETEGVSLRAKKTKDEGQGGREGGRGAAG
jgi:hypothetical protein